MGGLFGRLGLGKRIARPPNGHKHTVVIAYIRIDSEIEHEEVGCSGAELHTGLCGFEKG